MTDGVYEIPKEEVMQPSEYVEFFADRVAEAIVKAWESRQLGKVGWGQGQAVVAHNRRAVFADGSATMYGRPDQANFRMLEGYEDHDVDVLFFWNADDKLLATAINVPWERSAAFGRNQNESPTETSYGGEVKCSHGTQKLTASNAEKFKDYNCSSLCFSDSLRWSLGLLQQLNCFVSLFNISEFDFRISIWR
jgi:hypothetical protein